MTDVGSCLEILNKKGHAQILKGKQCTTTEHIIEMFKEGDSDDEFLGLNCINNIFI